MSLEAEFRPRNKLVSRLAVQNTAGDLLLLKPAFGQWEFPGGDVALKPRLDIQLSLGALPELLEMNMFNAYLGIVAVKRAKRQTGLRHMSVRPPMMLIAESVITEAEFPGGVYAEFCAPAFGEGDVVINSDEHSDYAWEPYAAVTAYDLSPLSRSAAEMLEPHLII